MRSLILGLGNDLLADDGIGILAARSLKALGLPLVDVMETSQSGLVLMEHLEGYERAVLIDAVQSNQYPPGTVLQLDPNEISPVAAPSPHYAGLPEVMALAEALGLTFPHKLAIVAVVVADAETIGGTMTPAVKAAVPDIVAFVKDALSNPSSVTSG